MTDRLSTGCPASSLDAAKNDTGRVAFCGPYVLSAITGFGISKIEDVIREGRDLPPIASPSFAAPMPTKSKRRWLISDSEWS